VAIGIDDVLMRKDAIGDDKVVDRLLETLLHEVTPAVIRVRSVDGTSGAIIPA
jgi:hypothetical protein